VIAWTRKQLSKLFEPPRTCWVTCPVCRRDLNGDNLSFVGETPDLVVSYCCASCGCQSRFLFDTPVPILLTFDSTKPPD